MTDKRWLRIIPVALIMYTISYIDRTNVSLALDPTISTMMKDLMMDDRLKGQAAGIFFLGYVLLQIPGGFLASRWSAKKTIAIFLVLWGICAVGCGMVNNYNQFRVMRFLLGVAESGVFPATLVLLTQWFPKHERARANAYWNLCQPLAVAASAPLTGWLLGLYGWKTMIILEGALPFIWLPIWLYYIDDRPRDAKWLTQEEKDRLENELANESNDLKTVNAKPSWRDVLKPAVFTMVVVYFLQNCANYGLMTFLSEGLKTKVQKTGFEYGVLFAIPYICSAVVMILISRHSDKTRERRGHVAFVYTVSGVSLVLSVIVSPYSFWLSYLFICLAVPGPFAGLAPFWAIPAETMPRSVMGIVMGLVNAIGNLGGFLGPFIAGAIKKETHSLILPFFVLGGCLIVAGAFAMLLPKSPQYTSKATQ